jgi:hypothetical protein
MDTGGWWGKRAAKQNGLARIAVVGTAVGWSSTPSSLPSARAGAALSCTAAPLFPRQGSHIWTQCSEHLKHAQIFSFKEHKVLQLQKKILRKLKKICRL